ncbi:MAG: GGDEF domain-containing protein [Aquabacterium sp.]|uniref:GGDEF domain-containing protein n=1 Tax=Aquabacterium sp. TaxID=1872578 RepID=UPI0025B9CD59|nr:GGDEF domain-containing protein [Aquabacterium sp.]MBI3380556.1 GGDEF domain-containing protein [Aquabacterium sp.]
MSKLSDLVLGTEPKLRARVAMTLLALYGYAACTGILLYLVHIQEVPSRTAMPLVAFMWTGVPLFYLLVRTGISNRLGSPGMDLPQCLFAMASILIAYVIVGPLRNAVLLLIALVMVFSMITLTPRQVRIMGVSTFGCLGLAMAWLTLHEPGQVDVRMEVMKFVLAACTLPVISTVASHVAKLRTKLVDQKQELQHALSMLHEVATRDELTGLHNRRHMHQLLEQQFKRQLRSGEGFCLALIDLDHFKHVNDQFGHQMGDTVLKAFAEAIGKELRQTDVLARWGGEEFLLMLTAPDPGLHGAQASLARFQAALQQVVVGNGVRITFSAGLTEHPPGEPLHETLERADRGLYQAKAHGRNRVELVLPPADQSHSARTPLAEDDQV